MKDIISKQMPGLLKKYLQFSDYQGKSVEDIFSKEELKRAIHLRVYETATSILWNDHGKFSRQPLPNIAQLAPSYAILAIDINNDGHKDIVLGGNQYNAQPQTGIYAGSYGAVMMNNGNRKFNPVSSENSGFFIKGQIRDIQKLRFKNEDLVIVAQNDDSLAVFKIRRK